MIPRTVFASTLAVIAFTVLLAVPAAHAGWKYPQPVRVFSSGGYVGASGSFSDTWNSTDTESYMVCGLQNGIGYCYALDSSGGWADCSTSDPALMQTIAAMHGDSIIGFGYATSNQICTYISTQIASYTAPKHS